MDEYTSWCDTEISDTNYAIETAGKSIDNYKAAIEQSQNTIQAKEAEVAERGTTISAKEKEAADAEEAELINSIDELSGAIVQLKKGASLIQVQKKLQPFADVLGRIVDATGVNVAKKRALAGFLQTEDKEDADLSLNTPQGTVDIGGGGHSDGIMQTLEDMKTKAEDQLSAARKGAMEARHNHDMMTMGINDEVKNL